MAVDNAIKLLQARGRETVHDLDTVIDALIRWQELTDNPQDAHLIDFVRVYEVTRNATNALYRLEQHSEQYRKLSLSGQPPRLIEQKA